MKSKFEKQLRHQQGFSILELCMWLMIIGLFAGSMNYVYSRAMIRAKTQALQRRLESVLIDIRYHLSQNDNVVSNNKDFMMDIETSRQSIPSEDGRKEIKQKKTVQKKPEPKPELKPENPPSPNKKLQDQKLLGECPGGGKLFLLKKMECWWVYLESSQLPKSSLEKIGSKMGTDFMLEEGPPLVLAIRVDI